jgi:two-component system, NtrC family, response regulator AtoC
LHAKVLVVDDQENQRKLLTEILISEGKMTAFQAGNVDDALVLIKEHMPEVILTDLKMPGKSGLTLVEEISSLPLPPEVIVITAFGSIETAIKATKLGVYDYVTKPVKPTEVIFLIEKAREKFILRQERQLLKQVLTEQVSSNLIARSSVMMKILEMVDTVSKTNSTVLIRGETGTGKECVARLIHLKSLRSTKLMKSLNCSAFAESLLDSEFFGYEKGAFTGAQSRKIGVIEAASGGTLFLDEVADMSQSTQAKILRTLQEKTIRRVGGTEDIEVDIRIIAATNKNLESAISNGEFRQDLFYRLNIVPIYIPALRERKEDIPELINHFLRRFGQVKTIDENAMNALLQYSWPGNVRELEAAIERIAVFSRDTVIKSDDLPAEISKSPLNSANTPWDLPDDGIVFEDLERDLLSKALAKTNGNMINAAKLLGMTYRAFRYRANSFGLRG